MENSLSQSDPETPVAQRPHFVVPSRRDPSFVRRPDIEAWLHEHQAATTRPIALIGPGGCGKSHIVIHVAHELYRSFPERSVLWVDSSTRATFEESYRYIADSLQLPRRHEPTVNILELVRNWLLEEQVAPWLMIVDNADDSSLFFDEESEEQPLETCLPKTRNGQILVTSRDLGVAQRLTGGNQQAIRQISTMDCATALQVIQNKLTTAGFVQDAATELAGLLDFLPLALSQATAYINQRQISIQQYIDLFRRSSSERQTASSSPNNDDDNNMSERVPDAVHVTWQVIFEQIRRDKPTAADLLSLMSCFQPHKIPHDVLYAYSSDRTDLDSKDDGKKEVDDDARILSDYSLIRETTATDLSEMHRLVKFCTKTWLVNAGQWSRWSLVYLHLMAEQFPGGHFESWSACQSLMPHVEDILHKRTPGEKRQDGVMWGLLLHKVSGYYLNLGNYSKAERLAAQAVEVRQKLLGANDAKALDSMDKLASIYWNQGRWKEAETLGLQVVDSRKAAFGANDPDTLTSMSNLATVYHAQGKLELSIQLEKEVLKVRQDILGAENAQSITTMSNLASTYVDQGRLAEAEKLFEQVVQVSEARLGPDHPDTLTRRANLAATYRFQHRWDEAKALFTQVTEARQAILGVDHPDTLSSRTHLAGIRRIQGEFEEAAALEMQILQASKGKLGADHPSTVKSMLHLGLTYYDQGKLEDAEQVFEEALRISRARLGDGHPDTLSCMANVAMTCWKMGRLDEAQRLEEEVLNARVALLGPDHPDTLIASCNLGATYHHLGRLNEARELESRALEVRRAKFGIDHPDTLMGMVNLSFSLKELGLWDEAFELINDAIARRKRILGPEHPDTASAMHAKATWEQERFGKPDL